MHLRLREKERFYRELGQLLRGGVAVPAALQSIAKNSRGSYGRFVRRLHSATSAGDSLGDAFTDAGGVSGLEMSIIRASERGGRLEHACVYLANYFETLHRTRSSLISRSLYPLFIFHLAVFLIALPRVIISGGGPAAYLSATAGFLFVLYMLAAVAVAAILVAVPAASKSKSVDRLIGLVPVAGGIRRNFALARFSMTLDMQLEARLNVMEGIRGAGDASQSALLRSAAERAAEEVRRGEQLGAALEATGAFPENFARAIRLGEETGGIDRELQRLATEYQQRAEQRAAALSDWGSKLLYLAVMLYLVWQIVRLYSGVLKTYSEFLA